MCPRLVFAALLALAATTVSGTTLAGDSGTGGAAPPAADAQAMATADWRSPGIFAGALAGTASHAAEVAPVPLTMLSSPTVWQSWGDPQARWSFASLVIGPALPSAYGSGTPATAASGSGAQANAPHYVIGVMPLAASYRINQSNRITVAYGMPATNTASGNWRPNNTDPSFWTFTPKVAFAQEVPSADQQSATVFGVNVFSTRSSQMYENTAVGRVEAMVMHQNANGWGFGGVAAAIEQFSEDPGTPSNKPPSLNGNDGMGLGVGPQVTWDTRWLGGNVQLRYRWIYELHGPGGHTIQPMLLSATVHL
ncbi:hypothetical protein [Dyella sp. C9]|uniref:hypothetical protein n=1 Tax=Dyella sp. C9 TaxID=2202154 RepID=UPI001300A257|nr:hypothetical protein [Dyella sp. C9]